MKIKQQKDETVEIQFLPAGSVFEIQGIPYEKADLSGILGEIPKTTVYAISFETGLVSEFHAASRVYPKGRSVVDVKGSTGEEILAILKAEKESAEKAVETASA